MKIFYKANNRTAIAQTTTTVVAAAVVLAVLLASSSVPIRSVLATSEQPQTDNNNEETTTTPATVTLTVVSKCTEDSIPLEGKYTTILKDGTMVDWGFTPKQFTLESGAEYQVTVANWINAIFAHWEDGSTSNLDWGAVRTMAITEEDTTITAYYECLVDNGDSEGLSGDNVENEGNNGNDNQQPAIETTENGSTYNDYLGYFIKTYVSEHGTANLPEHSNEDNFNNNFLMYAYPINYLFTIENTDATH